MASSWHCDANEPIAVYLVARGYIACDAVSMMEWLDVEA